MEMDKGEIEIILRRLNEKQRQIILLRCEGKTHEEVAGLAYVSVPHSKKNNFPALPNALLN